MSKIALCVSYNGSAYHGWQTQQDLPTIQTVLENALSSVADRPVSVICAGRTDAGVHASAQVIHFETEAIRSEYSWLFGTNSNLPADISVCWVKEVHGDFHARYSATARSYRYVIDNHPIRPSILRHLVGWCYQPLDADRMQLAAQHLVGEHDFTSFRGAGCQSNSPMRDLQEIQVYREGEMVIIEVRANAFLLHMVRNIVGALIAVGSGEQNPDWLAYLLKVKDRRKAGITAPASGLYLVEVHYPELFGLPAMPKLSLFSV